MTAPRIRVLVVDDSAFVRKVVREILADQADVEVVGFARDGLDALEKIAELRPDVITLDLVMPGLDGVGLLTALADRADAPRAVVVSIADASSDVAVAALTAGAFTIIHKPTAIATDRMYEVRAELLAAVRAAASAPARARAAPPATKLALAAEDAAVDLVVIGASTGGPQAVAGLLASFDRDFPVPIAVVLHMPLGFTASYAERIDRECALAVREASDGLAIPAGTVAIGRAGAHLLLRREGAGAVARLADEPLTTPHRPSVDVLFASAAEGWGSRVLGVVLTGMGDDGLAGSRAIRDAEGRVLAEAESSCVVYGMPRAVAEAGLASAVVPLAGMGQAIARAVRAR